LVGVVLMGGLSFVNAAVPSFDDNFASYLTDDTPDQYGRKETVFDLCIDKNLSLMDNVRRLFYPNIATPECASSRGGLLWDVLRIVGFAVLFIFLVFTGIQFITEADNPDKMKSAAKNIMFILYGAFLFFGATWLLGTEVLNIQYLTWTQSLVDKIQGGQDSLFYQILAFFKVVAFFVAIIMMVVYGFKMMAAMDQEERIKSARKGILNVLIALVLIKVIDYVFYITQIPEFAQKGADLIIEVSKIMWFMLGAALVLALFYAGFLLLTGGGNDEQFKKAKNIILGILLAGVVVFLFILIIYQVFSEFTIGAVG